MRLPLRFSFAACLALIALTDAQAGPLTITNPGFESPAAANGFVVIGNPTGWTAYGSLNGTSRAVGVINPTGTGHYPGSPEGLNAGVVFLSDNGPESPAGLQQTLIGTTLQANTLYTLRVEVGNMDSGTANFGFFNLKGFPGYRIDLLAGGVVIGSDNNSLAGSIPEGEFRTSTVSVSVGATHAQLGQDIGIRLVNLDLTGTTEQPGVEVNFDNVRLDADPVPEPAGAALLAGGMMSVLMMRRRQG